MNSSIRHNQTIAINHVTCLGDQKYPSFELKRIIAYLTDQGHGIWCEKLLDNLDLTPADLNKAFISAHQALESLRRVIDQFYQPGLGCQIALTYRLQDFGIIGSCISNSSTLGEAMEITQDYYAFIGSFTDIINIANEQTFINRLVDVSGLDPRIMQFLFELTVSGMRKIGQELSGRKFPIKAIRFVDKLDTQTKQQYKEFFGCTIEDQAKFSEWEVDIRMLDYPVTLKTSSETMTSNLKILLDKLDQERGLVDDIDHILKDASGNYPNPEAIAHTLCISPRTLRRKLKQVGTSYRALIDKVRCQLAIALIQHRNLTNEAIAEELGYSEAANFFNAFKKWTGHTPNHYRVKTKP